MGAIFLLPLIAALAHPGLVLPFKLGAAALVVTSALAPRPGLYALALLLPFSASMERWFGGMPGAAGVTDALLLAFLAGASWRLAWPRDVRPSHLAAPALVLLAAVLTSTIVEIRLLQRVTPGVPLLPELWRYLTSEYWTTAREFPVLHQAVRWTCWLVLAVYVEGIVAATDSRARDVSVWVLAGMAGAALTVTSVVGFVLGSEAPAAVAMDVIVRGRVSVLQPDVNAAGSYFALFLLPAVVLGIRRGARWLPAVAVPIVGFAFLAARSRAAFAAVVCVSCVAALAHLRRVTPIAAGPSRAVRTALILTVVAVVGGGGLFLVTSRSNVGPGAAVEFRIETTRIAVEAMRRYPAFGVGLGDYVRSTRRFITEDFPSMRVHAPNGENAHNNFLQIAVELGVPALVVFLWLVGPVIVTGIRGTPGTVPSPELEGMACGLAAFLASALLGHPLLIPQVGVAFFAALGMTAGLLPRRPPSERTRLVALLAAAGYVASLVWRLT